MGSNDGQPLHPVEDAQVCYWRYHAIGSGASEWLGCVHAKADGSYTVHGLRPGQYGLRVQIEEYGHAFYGNAFSESESTRVVLQSGDMKTGIDFELGPGGVIEGTVYSGDGKMALKDIGYELNDGKLGGCTDSNGRFRVPLAYGSYTVHVGHNFCGIDSYAIEWWQDASSYDHRTEIVLNAANPLRSDIDFTLDRLESVEIDEIDSETVLEIATGDETTTITIPPNAVAEPIKLVYRETDADAPSSGFQLAGRAFDLSAFRNDQRLENYSFQKPIVIEIEYSDADITGLDEATLTLNYWDTETEAWQDAACGPYDRRPDENKLAASVCHLTTFGVVGEEFATENRLHLPVIFGQ